MTIKYLFSPPQRKIWFCLFGLLALGLLAIPSELRASWFIDPARLHISIHGDMTCEDCHIEVFEDDSHPDSDNVVKTKRERFNPDGCLMCHDYIADDLEEGLHGEREVKNPERYETCTICHNPHTLGLRDPDSRDSFSPDRPWSRQCDVCHDNRDALPEPGEETARCLGCHTRPEGPPAAVKEALDRLCLTCHAPQGDQEAGSSIPLVSPKAIQGSPHGSLNCLECHDRAAAYRHDRQESPDCLGCHPRHNESDIRDAHFGVDCQACHFSNVKPERDHISGRITAVPDRSDSRVEAVHALVDAANDDNCRRCHFPDNTLGAASMVLPAKSLICMPCHTATLSVSDPVTIIALLVFIFGLIAAVSVWFSGEREDSNPSTVLGNVFAAIFSSKIIVVIKALVLDGLLQRKLFRHSPDRWFIHALIFWPFVLRFTWGIITLAGTSLTDFGPTLTAMMNKNHAATALFFDLSGIPVLVGVILAVVRRMLSDQSGRVENLPEQDRLALGLLAGIVVVGYFLEGLRLAMTMTQAPGASWAFIGYGLSLIFENFSNLTSVYNIIYYLHAVLTGAFVAYLPFSRMFHIIMGPIVAAVNAASSDHQRH